MAPTTTKVILDEPKWPAVQRLESVLGYIETTFRGVDDSPPIKIYGVPEPKALFATAYAGKQCGEEIYG